MPQRLDLTGLTFEKLTIVGAGVPYSNGHSRWLVRCACGKTKSVLTGDLTSGDTKSCGTTGCRCNTTHGASSIATRTEKEKILYRCWNGMKYRCFREKDKAFKDYGGRGITVCARWAHSFVAFWNDVESTWQPGLTIDRINNDGNYELGNVRWITRKQQNSNRRPYRNRRVEHHLELSLWANPAEKEQSENESWKD
jgi:hypothetical protein